MPHTLLLADDSPTIHRVVELTFAGADIRVVTAEDGEQAIALVRSERPDIVLADIGMPKKSGYEVAEFVKQTPEFAHIPVLLLAGAFDPVDDLRVEQTGCDGVLVKPFEPRHVIERVRELLGGAQGSPTTAASAVPRPVERLAPSLDLTSLDIPPSRPLRLISTPQRTGEDGEALPHDPASSSHGQSLDDYFDQLDAAFSARDTGFDRRVAEPSALDGSATGVHPQHQARAGKASEPEFDVFDLPPLAGPEARPGPVMDGEATDVVLETTPARPTSNGRAQADDGADAFAFDLDDILALSGPAAEPGLMVSTPAWETSAQPEAAEPPVFAPAVPPTVAPVEPAALVPVPATPAAADIAAAPPRVPDATMPSASDLAAQLLADEAFAAALAARVAARLGSSAVDGVLRAVVKELVADTVKRTVADAVSEIAERLIHEEIARLTSKLPGA